MMLLLLTESLHNLNQLGHRIVQHVAHIPKSLMIYGSVKVAIAFEKHRLVMSNVYARSTAFSFSLRFLMGKVTTYW